MSRWELSTNGLTPEQAYGKYYEGYTQMLKRQGITGEELKARQGEYAKALHKKLYQETSAKSFGRDYGRALAQEGNVARAQNQLRIVEEALAGGGTSTTYFGTPEQLRSAAPLGNIAPEATNEVKIAKKYKKGTAKTGFKYFVQDTNGNVYELAGKQEYNQVKKGKMFNVTGAKTVAPAAPNPAPTSAAPRAAAPAQTLSPEAQRHLDAARRAEQGARFRGTSQEAMNRLHHIGEESDLTRYYREMENQGEIGRQKTIKKPLDPEAQKYLDAAKRAEKGSKFMTSSKIIDRQLGIGQESDLTRWYREMENQGEIGRHWEKPTPKPEPTPEPTPGPKPTPEPGPKPTPKPGPKKLAGLKKAGKWGLAALAAGALIYGLVKGCSGDKKEEAVAPQPKSDPKSQTKPDTQPESTTPQQPEQSETPPVEIENIIQNADTLEEVANRYGITVDELKELNADKIKQFRTADGRVIEGFQVGEDIKLPDSAKKVDGLRSKEESISDYEEALIRNFDTIPQSMWNQVCTPEFRRRHKLGEYKEAA